MTITSTSIILFSLATITGLLVASRAMAQPTPPAALAILHGLFAVSGLILLAIVISNTTSVGIGAWALGLVVVTALSGVILSSYHLRKRPLPSGQIVLHGMIAVVALALVIFWSTR